MFAPETGGGPRTALAVALKGLYLMALPQETGGEAAQEVVTAMWVALPSALLEPGTFGATPCTPLPSDPVADGLSGSKLPPSKANRAVSL